ncbi:MAG: hypothetical protein JW722_03365 [Demequinaceae bacterium]|nr:hypothetical protein [Demequinaceae bacterium]
MTENDEPDDLGDGNESAEEGVVDLAGEVRDVATSGWPSGYVYGATRYADVILRQSFPERFADLIAALSAFRPTLTELRSSGGGRAVFTKRFDDSLAAMTYAGETIWGKQNVTIEKVVGLDGTAMRRTRTRGHEIDMFGKGTLAQPLPGIAVEMEWNNKDPFYDRDLNNFQALHHEGAIAVGVIVTRGPALQALIGMTVRSKDGGLKFGQSSTHWSKLIPKVNLGGGGECPLLLIGIEPERIDGIDLARQVKSKLEAMDATQGKGVWRSHWATYEAAQAAWKAMREEAEALMPPLAEEKSDDEGES